MLAPSLYQVVFNCFIGVMAILFGLKYLSSNGDEYSQKGMPGTTWICLVICVVLTWWLGGRPASSVFGDTYSYHHSYINGSLRKPVISLSGEWVLDWIMYQCRVYGLNYHIFFTIFDAIYLFTSLWAIRIMMPKNPLLGFVFVLSSFSFFSFGVNGIRNGAACHMLLLAFAFYLDSKYIPAIILALISFSTHRSTALPIASFIAALWFIKSPIQAVYIWIGSIFLSIIAGSWFIGFFASLGFDSRMESYASLDTGKFGFSNTGYRWDFLIYGAMPVLMGYIVLVKKEIKENWFRVLFVTYALANSFWILINRAAFSNRFAYLSWFMYPIIIAYPLIMMRVWPDQDRRTAIILFAYCAFTIFMNR